MIIICSITNDGGIASPEEGVPCQYATNQPYNVLSMSNNLQVRVELVPYKIEPSLDEILFDCWNFPTCFRDKEPQWPAKISIF